MNASRVDVLGATGDLTGRYRLRALAGRDRGRVALALRGDEAEVSWAVVEPILAAWADGAAPLREHPAGSAGPR